MKDCFEVIRDVQMPATSGRGPQPVGIEGAAAIVAALNREGLVIVAAIPPLKEPGRACIGWTE